MKRVLVITTGGTIVSTNGENGLEPNNNSLLKDLFNNYNYEFDFLPIFNIDSSNMAVENWIELGKVIDDKYSNYNGIIITHGTDTLAYTASALWVMLKNIPIPVVLTGSQLPIEVKNTDAVSNIDLAVKVAVSNLKGVFVAFANKIIQGNCASKVYAKSLAAFESINNDYVNISDITVIKNDYSFNSNFSKVFLLKVTPLTDANVIDAVVNLGYKGIIIEGYGAGGLNENYILPIKNAVAKGVKVGVTSQCLYDNADYSLYKVGKQIIDAGAFSCGEMTSEFAVVKLANEIK